MHTLIWYPAQSSRRGASPMQFRDYADLFARDGTFPAQNEAGRGAALAGLVQYLQQSDSTLTIIEREPASPVHTFETLCRCRAHSRW